MGYKGLAKVMGMATVAFAMTVGVSLAASPAKINADSVNFREKADMTSNVLGQFNKGESVNVESKEGQWSKVIVGEKTGYISSQYLGESVSSSKYGIGLLKVGSRGASVTAVQTRLAELKYFNTDVTGYYGHITADAVKAFQEKNGLKADGIVGSQVREKLEGGLVAPAVEDKLKVEKISWSDMSGVIPRGNNFTIMDVSSGKRFTAKRRGGSNHIDTEPLTSKDTAIMKEIYGGNWSWNRRAVVVIYNGKAYAASMNGMPHGGGEISGNGFNGHFCVHFLGSKTHGSKKVDGIHQSAVATAANVGSVAK